MNDTLVLRGADGRTQPHDKPIGFFFTSDPQTDTLLPASLLNGFALEGQPGRVDSEVMFPFLDMMIKGLADDCKHRTGTVGQRISRIVTNSLRGGVAFEQAVSEHKNEILTFARNRIEHPYNLLRDFEDSTENYDSAVDAQNESAFARNGSKQSDPVAKEDERVIMRHRNGRKKICAYRLSTMASLEQIVSEWSQGSLIQNLAREVAPERLPDFLVLQLGKWRRDSSMVLVLLQLSLDRVTLIDRYTEEDHMPTLTLLHLGPATVPVQRDDFFDDMLELDEAIATRQIYGVPLIRKLRLWQSHVDSHHKGSITALQAFYADSANPSTMFRAPVRGQRDAAHFFVDIVLGEGEFILEISCFYVAGLYGAITIQTNAGVYSAGAREAGSHHLIEIPRQDLFDAVAFVGETGRDGSLTCLKVIAVQPHHFGTACGPKPPLQSSTSEEMSNMSLRKHNVLSHEHQRPRAIMLEESSTNDRSGAVHTQSCAHSRTAPPQGRVRPSSALSRGGPHTQLPKRPQSALARQPGLGQAGLDSVRRGTERGTENPLPAKSAGSGTQFEKNLEMSAKRVHQNDIPGGRRIQVKANDSEVDALLTASMVDEEAQSADWKTSIRSAIAQGVITAQSRLLLQVEYCTATRPSSTLRGSKEQYSKVVTDLKEKVATFLWEYNAVVLDNRKFDFWAENEDCVTSPILKPRIGSCEIVLSWQHRSTPRTIVIHSKLHSRKWPVVETIVEELQAILPAQYHDIRFLAQSSLQNSCPKGAKFTVVMRRGNDPLGIVGKKATVIADADGVAHISLPVGAYDVKVEHENFLPHTFDYRIGTPGNDLYQPFRRVIMHPKCEKDEIKISLIWNESPSDLDLYAVTPYTKVFHHRRHDELSSCVLGEQAREGYGPETISFKRLTKQQHTEHLREMRTCNLHIYVHNYSEECDITESGAVLTIMGETGILHQLEVPKVGAGEFWDVCSIDMRHLLMVDRNRITPAEPVFDILVSHGVDGGEDIYVKSTCEEMGSAAAFTKEEVKKSPAGGGSLARSVALLHDYHNYNGIR